MCNQRIAWIGRLILCVGLALGAADAAAGPFETGLEQLTGKSFDDKAAGVAAIAASGDPRAIRLLETMLAGDLYYRKSDNRLVRTESSGDGYRLSDILTGETLGEVGRREVKKVSINNRLRGELKAAIAGLELGHADPAVRLAAVNRMLDRLDADAVALIAGYRAREPDPAVQEAMEIALAIGTLYSGEPTARLAALDALDGNLHPAARNALVALDDPSNDPQVVEHARRVLRGIEHRLELYATAETLFFGLSLGSVLVLAAIGLAITFGVMGVINMAHGELIMLGAYTTYVVQLLMPNQIGLSLLVAVPAAFLVSGLVGIAIERSVIRFLYGRPLETLLATFGISLILQQAVRTIFSPLNRSVETPAWMAGSWEINSALSLTLNRLYILAFCLLVFAALYLVLRHTALGLQVRAVSQNRAMARAMGVRSARVDALTFGLGSGIAGVAGVALSQLTNVGPNLGQAYIIDSFLVVVFGGVGNLWGTLISGLSLGVANKFLEPWSGAVLAKILVLVAIILFIQKRPRGLFPQVGRAVEG